MIDQYKRINGMQHIGVAVSDMDRSLKYYRKFFGLDIPFFDSVQPAPLMDYYTRGETITKRASMVMNLQGGCAIEVIRPTSFHPRKADFEIQLGDLGILVNTVKCKSIHASYEFCKNNGALWISALGATPDQRPTFYIKDPDHLIWQFVASDEWYTNSKHHSGGVIACSIGVTDIEESKKLYSSILGFDLVVNDQSGVFDDWKELPGGNQRYRRVLLGQSAPPGGGFAKVTGHNFIELIQCLERAPREIFKDRIWGDIGYAHLGLDVKGMENLGEELKRSGFPFTCDSRSALNMGNTKVHCTYIHDRDRTLIEFIEVYKVPIVEKWGIFLNVANRDPLKPLPDFMLKALRFSRVKENS
jgi:catechol 2,3-dioxygenase-like lactoylglutathione lyase family enzyme